MIFSAWPARRGLYAGGKSVSDVPTDEEVSVEEAAEEEGDLSSV
jgi:hypothetical protein